ncbi:MAG TPA: adenylate/guanylate cyclase domain-containing protein [Devosia sp.]|nr:adenylate/guanylate cyclase domain-containing protein [Devosia sp.]
MLLGLLTVALLAWLRLADPYPVRALRDIGFDVFEQFAPRPASAAPVRIVDIDEASLAKIGQWPWPRDVLARLTQRLTELGAASIAFDVLFPEPDRLSPAALAQSLAADATVTPLHGDLPDYDTDFAAALAGAPAVLGFGTLPRPTALPARAKAGFAIVGDGPIAAAPPFAGIVQSLPVLVNAAKGSGSIALDPTGSVGTVRRLPLLWSAGGQLYPALSLEALRIALGQQSVIVFGDQTGQGTISAIRVGDFSIPTNSDGSIWLYYERPPASLYVSAADILSDGYKSKADLISGQIVLIGTSASGLQDIRGTPLGYDVPGVEVHAQALQQIVDHRFLSRADWVNGLEVLAFVLIGAAIVVITLLSGPWVCLAVGAFLASIVAGLSWFGFAQASVLIDPTFPLLGSLIVYSAMIFFQYGIADADKRMIRRAFGHYVAPALLEQIEKRRHSLKLGGETRELSILFLDIRNFTSISETVEPAHLLTILTTLFTRLGASITANSGTIDKFIGDAIMAFWNAPLDVDRHPYRSCMAALEMRGALAQLNAEGAFGLGDGIGGPISTIAVGIGISTGPALVGNFGLETQFNYSCVGDTVNVASRVEGACKAIAYDIAVSASTQVASAGLAFLDAGHMELKGKQEREHVFILVGDEHLARSEAFQTLQKAHAEAIDRLVAAQPAADAIADCTGLASEVEPGLVGFYQRLSQRQDDFAFDLTPVDGEAAGERAIAGVTA